ncbi:MAG: tetratricopeptide repeat protein [Bacteroidales bacterium]|nr:tetratricopeptide repeat protein [Bacteroidales bacterium]
MKKGLVFLCLWSIIYLVNANDSTRCDALIERAYSAYDKQNFEQALTYFSQAIQIANVKGCVEQKAKILNGYGVIYMKLYDHHRAVKYFFDAYALVEGKQYPKVEISILNNLARICFFEEKPYKAMNYLEKSLQIAQNLGDSTLICRIGINTGITYNNLGKPEQAKEYFQKAINYLQNKPKYILSLQKAQIEYVNNLILRQEYMQAEAFATQILAQHATSTQFPLKSLCYWYLSVAQENQNKLQSALNTLKKADTLFADMDTRVKIFKSTANIYNKLKQPLLALQYKDSIIKYKDSIIVKSNKDKFLNVDARIRLNQKENELELQQARQDKERMFFTLLIVAFVSVILLLFIRAKQQKQKRILALEKEKTAKLLFENQLKEKQLEEDKLLREIELKNNQLSAQILLQSHKNELIEDIIEKLSAISETSKHRQLTTIIHQLKQQIKENSDWKSFLTFFEQINPALLTAIRKRYNYFTISELRILSYIFMDMDTKEIARLLNITDDYCRKKKQRIAKKLNISTSQIRQHLHDISQNEDVENS